MNAIVAVVGAGAAACCCGVSGLGFSGSAGLKGSTTSLTRIIPPGSVVTSAVSDLK